MPRSVLRGAVRPSKRLRGVFEWSRVGCVGERRTDDPRRRLTVAQAADQLGISVDAMRARVKRRTVATEREGGRVYILLDAAQDAAQDAPRVDESNALTSQLREEVAYLREENRRKDHIIAGLVERIPAIEAPQDAKEEPEGVEPQTGAPGAQEGTRRGWGRAVVTETGRVLYGQLLFYALPLLVPSVIGLALTFVALMRGYTEPALVFASVGILLGTVMQYVFLRWLFFKDAREDQEEDG